MPAAGPAAGIPAGQADGPSAGGAGDAAAVDVVLSQERAMFGTARVPVERVRLVRRVVTETVNVPVTVRREELVVTREPVAAGPGGASVDEPLGTSSGGTEDVGGATDGAEPSFLPPAAPGPPLVILLRREVPVVSTAVELTERVTVHVDVVRSEQVVSTAVRRERAGIEPDDRH